jgi:putative heme iron utilization protein
MPFALDQEGRPLFLISKMAMHTQNLDQDPRCSLLVPEDSGEKNPLGIGRVTLLGQAEAVPTTETKAARTLYLKRHEKARYWVDYQDFGFYRLDVLNVYFVGGFGVMGWVEAPDYTVAQPDPLADHAHGIIQHMNEDHRDALVLLAKECADLDAEEAEMTAVDRLGFHLRLKVAGHYQGCRIAFVREARTSKETRMVLVEMVKAARLSKASSQEASGSEGPQRAKFSQEA